MRGRAKIEKKRPDTLAGPFLCRWNLLIALIHGECSWSHKRRQRFFYKIGLFVVVIDKKIIHVKIPAW